MPVLSQSIVWETDYPTALSKAQKDNKILVIYFNNGQSPNIERVIKKRILKSDEFKNNSNSIVGLLIEDANNNEKHRYNSRVISSYNKNKVFPAITAVRFKTRNYLPLLTKFEDANIELFLNEFKDLSN
ncbi:hypothetical protein GCM10011444_19890 [Winogradskyella haliclonae]|uniref:Uncharacterized protein n=2 Tax=Winogradskyella haliclonae TaxID=2048558 RepID=A0ABQ2C0F1_9FLAO|nr:hypothetical protein GCM10011444_19890 [Winogradskyella haliclonae]